jgi:hypothetical protein
MAEEKPGFIQLAWQSTKNLFTGRTSWQQAAEVKIAGPEAIETAKQANEQLLQGHFSKALELAVAGEKQYLHHVKAAVTGGEVTAPMTPAKGPANAKGGPTKAAPKKPSGPPPAPVLQ